MSSTEKRHQIEGHPPPTVCDVYESMLHSTGLGTAMLYPEPNHTGETQVGDVGVFVGGRFFRLLNVDATSDAKRVAHWDPPYEHHDILQLSLDRRSGCLASGNYTAHRLLTDEIGSYKLEENIRVSLNLKSPADSQSFYDSNAIDPFILKHVRSWLAYAQKVIGPDVALEHITFITGVVKTADNWAITLEGSGTAGQWSVRSEGRYHREVPRAGMPTDQCIFVRGKSAVRPIASFLPLRVVELRAPKGLP